jgi:hypothetical protein
MPLLPPEIIKAWTSNEYRIGDKHSIDYKYIGAALAVRGYYRYATFRETAKSKHLLHAGYCLIDFEGPDLFIAGIRVYTGPHQTAPHDDQRTWAHPIYWRSRYSKFVSDGTRLNLHFGYCAFKFRNIGDKHYHPDCISSGDPGTLPTDARKLFVGLEEKWKPRRTKLHDVCSDANSTGNFNSLDKVLATEGDDVMHDIQNKDVFLREIALLQHHAQEDELVGIITVDVGRTIATESEFVAVVYQPIDVPASA